MLIPLIPTKVHGIIDYVSAVVLIALPIFTGKDPSGGFFWICPTIAVFIIVYSLLTRYEAGFVGLLSFRTHLLFDIAAGLMLIAAPSLSGVGYENAGDMLYAGLAIVIIALLSRPVARRAHGPLLSSNSPSAPPEEIKIK
ncbi:MAG: hypothetical protein ACTHLE_08035 [Agriterribacter sp.]